MTVYSCLGSRLSTPGKKLFSVIPEEVLEILLFEHYQSLSGLPDVVLGRIHPQVSRDRHVHGWSQTFFLREQFKLK
jgi:hypothetical protein